MRIISRWQPCPASCLPAFTSCSLSCAQLSPLSHHHTSTSAPQCPIMQPIHQPHKLAPQLKPNQYWPLRTCSIQQYILSRLQHMCWTNQHSSTPETASQPNPTNTPQGLQDSLSPPCHSQHFMQRSHTHICKNNACGAYRPLPSWFSNGSPWPNSKWARKYKLHHPFEYGADGSMCGLRNGKSLSLCQVKCCPFVPMPKHCTLLNHQKTYNNTNRSPFSYPFVKFILPPTDRATQQADAG